MRQLIIDTAKYCAAHYDLPWRLIAAVAILESGGGRHTSAVNNYTGMKWAPSMWKEAGEVVKTTEYEDHVPHVERTHFVAYASMEACLLHLCETLRYSRHYALLNIRADSERTFYLMQFAASYATDPLYAYKINAIMGEL